MAPPSSPHSASTRDRILDAAEQLFAARGFAATSVRAVTATAGVNLAAVHYHFGSKDELIRAVLARRVEPINAERLARLDAVEARRAPDPPLLEEVLAAFIEPALAIGRSEDPRIQRIPLLLGRIHSEPSDRLQEVVADLFAGVKQRFVTAFSRVLPDLPEEVLYWRLGFLVGSMAYTLCAPRLLQVASGGLCRLDDADRVRDQWVAFVAGGLRAPAPGRGRGDS